MYLYACHFAHAPQQRVPGQLSELYPSLTDKNLEETLPEGQAKAAPSLYILSKHILH